MMLTVNRIEDRITGVMNGRSFSCSYNDEKYAAMRALEDKANKATTVDELSQVLVEFEPLTKESFKTLVESATPHLAVNPATNQFFLKVGEFISNKPLPPAFAERIMKAVEKGLDIEPLIKAWARFLRPIPGRPAYSAQRAQAFSEYISAPYVNPDTVRTLMSKEGLSEEVATRHATTTQVAITREGLLVCYKVSEEVTKKYALDENGERVEVDRYKKTVDPDTGLISLEEPAHAEDFVFRPIVMGDRGDAFFCENIVTGEKKKGHIIKVGCVHYLEDWNQVGAPGHKGLHCGGLEYIRGYQGQRGAVTHNIFVDPSDIHTVLQSQDCAMTVKRYFVASTFRGVNKNLYHSSTYAALTDADYNKLLNEVIAQELATASDKIQESREQAQMLR